MRAVVRRLGLVRATHMAEPEVAAHRRQLVVDHIRRRLGPARAIHRVEVAIHNQAAVRSPMAYHSRHMLPVAVAVAADQAAAADQAFRLVAVVAIEVVVMKLGVTGSGRSSGDLG